MNNPDIFGLTLPETTSNRKNAEHLSSHFNQQEFEL